MELTIAAGGSVKGVVQNLKKEPVGDSLVALIPAPGHRSNLNLFKTAFTDQYGQFSISGVAPGDYGVLAWEDVDPNAWLNADFLKPFDPPSATVHVSGASVSDATIRVIPYGN
jgi:hypothetical protein